MGYLMSDAICGLNAECGTAKRVWIPFSPSGYRGDARLRLVSAAARCLWIEMTSLMHEAEPYGHLFIPNTDIRPDVAQIAVLSNMPAPEVEGALKELLAFQIFRQTEDGTIYSPRLVADHQDYLKNRETGRKGGEASAKARAYPPAANSAPEVPVDPPAKGAVRKVTNPALKGGSDNEQPPST